MKEICGNRMRLGTKHRRLKILPAGLQRKPRFRPRRIAKAYPVGPTRHFILPSS